MKGRRVVSVAFAVVGSMGSGCPSDVEKGGTSSFESFRVPPEYISGFVTKVSDADVPANLARKWLGASGSTLELYDSTSGSFDYSSQSTRGDVLLYHLKGDDSYQLSYLYTADSGTCHSIVWGFEKGSYRITESTAPQNPNPSLELTPSTKDATWCACSHDKCTHGSGALQTRTYYLIAQVVTPYDSDGTKRNPALGMIGPCADYMITMNGYACDDQHDEQETLGMRFQEVD